MNWPSCTEYKDVGNRKPNEIKCSFQIVSIKNSIQYIYITVLIFGMFELSLSGILYQDDDDVNTRQQGLNYITKA